MVTLNNVNTLELNDDCNDEEARTREIDLARRRTRMLYSSFGLGYI